MLKGASGSRNPKTERRTAISLRASGGHAGPSTNNRSTATQSDPWKGVLRFVAHGRHVISIASSLGWRPGARYTNLRDIRTSAFAGRGFLDINWKAYDFDRHLDAAAQSRPLLTVARDVLQSRDLDKVLHEAEQLCRHSKWVVVVPKALNLAPVMEAEVPARYLFGYSVPTK